jgi:predicted nucleic acid-binding protein
VREEGSELAAQLWNARHPAASSILAYPEGRAALASARRARRLTPTGYRKALQDFETSHSELLVVAIDERLARHAGELAEGLALRGHDAVHLASSLALGPDTTVVTWDRDLNRAANDSGLAVAPAPGKPDPGSALK